MEGHESMLEGEREMKSLRFPCDHHRGKLAVSACLSQLCLANHCDTTHFVHLATSIMA